MKRRTALTMAALLLTGCGGPSPDERPEPTTGSSTPSPSAPTSAHPKEQQSRGYQQSPLPGFLSSPGENTAAEFVRIAATPDTRIDPTPTSTWQRASRLLTPELAAEISTQKNPLGGSWWTELVSQDGYITIVISNVLGETPQSSPGPDELETNSQERIFEVMFTRTLHHRTYKQQDEKTYLWTITLNPDGQITTFTTDH